MKYMEVIDILEMLLIMIHLNINLFISLNIWKHPRIIPRNQK